jgi:hypothetical protein
MELMSPKVSMRLNRIADIHDESGFISFDLVYGSLIWTSSTGPLSGIQQIIARALTALSSYKPNPEELCHDMNCRG